ncbi:MAG: biopolymer transporter ExbD [Oscillospiraceae bacterium]|nr:biopolymer transporter ExbD [Oscillospiraceae bacterium]
MKMKREVILDFTSLLDVIMLILFFFVIFATLDTNDAKSEAKAAQAEAEQQIADAQAEWKTADEAREKAEAELKKLEQDKALAESIIINGADDFKKALRLKLMLTYENDDWIITVNCPKEEKGEIRYTELGKITNVRKREDISEIAEDFRKLIDEYGYSREDAFLCDIMYYSDAPGSRLAKNNTDRMLSIFQNEFGYKYLFSSTTDLADIANTKG